MAQQTTVQTVIQPKSMAVAYILAIFLGGFGAHRFYLGRKGSAIAMLVLYLVGLLLAIVGVGLILDFAVGIWVIVDLFLIPGMVRNGPKQVVQQTVITHTQE